MTRRPTGPGPVDATLLGEDLVALYEHAPCGYLCTDPDGTVTRVNETFLTWTGYARADLVGRRTFADLLTGGGRIYHETHYAPMLRMQGTVREIALDLVRADGSRLPVLVNAALDRDDEGQPSVIRVVLLDARDRREYERELLRAKQEAEDSERRARALARTLQETLIPPTPPHVPGLDVAAVYRPAGSGTEVGGDFYDVFQVGAGDWSVVLGDVCGKGVEAAVVTALVRYTVRAACVRTPSPSEALRELNDVLLAHGTDRFSTLVLLRLRLDGPAWTVTLAAAGHPLPLLTDGTAVAPVGRPGSLVGVTSKVDVHDTEVVLRPGATLVAFTDGVTEGRRGRELYGEERLRAQVRAHAGDATELTRALVDDVLAYQDGRPRDDIAVVALHVPSRS